MENGVVSLINKFYRYVKLSLTFWIFTIKGMVIYGLIPSMFTLFLSMREVDETERDDIFEIYKKNYNNYKNLKFLSFCSVFLLIILYCTLFFISLELTLYSGIIKVVIIYLMSLIVLISSYSMYINVFEECSIKEALMKGFLISVKYFGVSIIYIVFISIYLKIGKANLILALCVHPFIIVLVVKYIFEKILPKMGYIGLK